MEEPSSFSFFLSIAQNVDLQGALWFYPGISASVMPTKSFQQNKIKNTFEDLCEKDKFLVPDQRQEKCDHATCLWFVHDTKMRKRPDLSSLTRMMTSTITEERSNSILFYERKMTV